MLDVEVLIYGLAALAGLLLFAAFLRWRFPKRRRTHGSARPMSLWAAVWRKVICWTTSRGILLGDLRPGTVLPVYYNGAASIMTIGAPGTGKTAGVLIPNAMRYPRIVGIDYGGEITGVCWDEWVRKGYSIQIFDPLGLSEKESVGFNAVWQLNPKSPLFGTDAALLAGGLIIRSGHEKDPYWNNQAENWLTAFLMHIRTALPPKRQNLPVLREIIMADRDTLMAWLADMRANKAHPAIARQAAEIERKIAMESKDFDGILSTIASSTRWMDDEPIANALRRGGLDFAHVKGRAKPAKPGAVAMLILPLAYAETYAPLAKLFIRAAQVAMMTPPYARRKVLFLVDEAAVIGRVPDLFQGAAFNRKYRIWTHFVFQSVGQIKRVNPESSDEVIGACECRQFLPPRDMETAQLVSDLAGVTTVLNESKREVCRPLWTPDEVLRMRENRQIVFIGGLDPALIVTRPYFHRMTLAWRASSSAFHEGLQPPLPPTLLLELAAGIVLRVVGWVLAPSRTFATLVLLVAAWWLGAFDGHGVDLARQACRPELGADFVTVCRWRLPWR